MPDYPTDEYYETIPSGCPCCDGETAFDWQIEACDDCAALILGNNYTDHPHELSDAQIEAVGLAVAHRITTAMLGNGGWPSE